MRSWPPPQPVCPSFSNGLRGSSPSRQPPLRNRPRESMTPPRTLAALLALYDYQVIRPFRAILVEQQHQIASLLSAPQYLSRLLAASPCSERVTVVGARSLKVVDERVEKSRWSHERGLCRLPTLHSIYLNQGLPPVCMDRASQSCLSSTTRCLVR